MNTDNPRNNAAESSEVANPIELSESARADINELLGHVASGIEESEREHIKNSFTNCGVVILGLSTLQCMANEPENPFAPLVDASMALLVPTIGRAMSEEFTDLAKGAGRSFEEVAKELQARVETVLDTMANELYDAGARGFVDREPEASREAAERIVASRAARRKNSQA